MKKYNSTSSLEKPSEALIEIVEGYDNISDREDRDKLSVLTYEFAQRVPSYDTTAETIVNIYGTASKEVVGSSMTGKYKDIKQLVGKDILSEILGDSDGFVDEELKKQLSDRFYTTSWVLGD